MSVTDILEFIGWHRMQMIMHFDPFFPPSRHC